MSTNLAEIAWVCVNSCVTYLHIRAFLWVCLFASGSTYAVASIEYPVEYRCGAPPDIIAVDGRTPGR